MDLRTGLTCEDRVHCTSGRPCSEEVGEAFLNSCRKAVMRLPLLPGCRQNLLLASVVIFPKCSISNAFPRVPCQWSAKMQRILLLRTMIFRGTLSLDPLGPPCSCGGPFECVF